jgi:glycine cleavage system H protein
MMEPEYLQITIDKFVFRVKTGCLYDEAGVWIAMDRATGIARVGLTDYRQQTSGDVAFVELAEPGIHVAAGDDLAAIETIKVDMAVPAPLTGIVTAVNPALHDAPELINRSPYGEGWLVEIRPDTWPEPGLLDAAAYLTVMTAQARSEAAG